MKILADASLPLLHELFGPPFELSLYHHTHDLPTMLSKHEILVCRSTLKVSKTLLAGSAIRCVATASSGIDHINQEALLTHGIRLFDAKGCNARAVADYVMTSIAFLVQTHQLKGHKAGVIGVGKVGSKVVQRLERAGFSVICYDPLRESVDNHYPYCSLNDLTHCDLLCIHANLHDTPPFPSTNLLSSEFLNALSPKTTIINAARGGILNEQALLETTHPLVYCTDVYLKEPSINPKIIDFATLCTPHIAGHSIEAKQNAVLKIRDQLYAHYAIPLPPLMSSIVPSANFSKKENGQLNGYDALLAIYNPFDDTHLLKKAPDKLKAFLNQREAHQNRHDFNLYVDDSYDPWTRELLGG